MPREDGAFDDACARGRHAYERRDWPGSDAAFEAADATGELIAADLECWGLAAFLCGRDDVADAARERAHHAFLAAGDRDAAARVAFWLGLALTLRGEPARGGGWFARMHAVGTEQDARVTVWTGYDLLNRGMRAFFGGDLATGRALADEAAAVAERFDDTALRILAANGRGQMRVAAGDFAAGLTELDEAMVLAITGDVSPQLVGLVSCAVINACRDCMDVGRSIEWTTQLSRWCESQPGLVAFRGQCLVHRSELLQLRGRWNDAMAEVDSVLERFARYPAELAAGDAHYQRGELHRIRGEHDAAETAYRQALRRGRDPQPGLALLRLAQGRVDTAAVAIARALREVTHRAARTSLLSAGVETALAARDVRAARTAAAELQQLSRSFASPYLGAVVAFARGAVDLAAGDGRAALGALREALACWTAIDAPYEAARCRVALARACRLVGDDDTAELELATARETLAQLCTPAEAARLCAATGSPSRGANAVPGGLTPREVEVLRLLATGVTNRAIAATLVLSEKTVARHVANIYAKIDVSSRSAATAYAFAHRLA